MAEDCTVDGLRLSSKRIGKLYPVLVDSHGKVLDGQHRLEADADWPKVMLGHIRSEKERILARLIGNVCRRTVSAEEKRSLLESLGRIYMMEGEKPGRLAFKIAEDTGMSYRWVMKYLPENMKSRPGLGGPSKLWESGKCKSRTNGRQIEKPSISPFAHILPYNQHKVVVVKTYVNATFVNLTIEKKFYENFEKLANQFGITPPELINDAMIIALREIENLAREQPVCADSNQKSRILG